MEYVCENQKRYTLRTQTNYLENIMNMDCTKLRFFFHFATVQVVM